MFTVLCMKDNSILNFDDFTKAYKYLQSRRATFVIPLPFGLVGLPGESEIVVYCPEKSEVVVVASDVDEAEIRAHDYGHRNASSRHTPRREHHRNLSLPNLFLENYSGQLLRVEKLA